MRRRDYIFIRKVISEIRVSQEMLDGISPDEFLHDEKLKRAVSMTVINIGELVKNITQETREQHADVPWRAVAGMRDIAAHRYQTLRMEDVYHTVREDFPRLRNQPEEIIGYE